MMLKPLRIIIAFLLLMSVNGELQAQTPPPSQPTAGAPLDGVSLLLVVAGAAYGSKQVRYKAKH